MPKEDSLKVLIKETRNCIKHDNIVAALYIAMSIVDLCSKIQYPNLKQKDRYPKWFEEYISVYTKSKRVFADMPYLSGKTAYQLRCALFHEGSNDIDGKIDIDHFELRFGKSARYSSSGYSSINGVKSNTELQINVPVLCEEIVGVAEDFYKQLKKNDTKLPQFSFGEIPDIFKAKTKEEYFKAAYKKFQPKTK